jgi:hypothetical protein
MLLALTNAAGAEPVTVAIALDTSGSIGKEEFVKARELCSSVLERLPSGSDAGLFTFDDQERLLLPWGSGPQEVRRALAIVQRTGRFTALHDALYSASRKLQAAPAGRKALLLITDGKDEGSTLTLEDGLRVAQDSHIPIWTIGVGHVQDKVLKRIAKLTAGEYVPLQSIDAPALAGKMASAPPAPGPGVASTDAAAVAPPPSGSASASSPSTAAASSPSTAGAPKPASATSRAAAPRAAVATGSGSMWLWAAGGALLLTGIGLAAMRRRAPHRCPTCGFELAGPLSTCTYCSAEANVRIAAHAGDRPAPLTLPPTTAGTRGTLPPGARSVSTSAYSSGNGNGNGHVEVLSPTVLARLNSTEEYLEKTVTLQEKPVLVITGGPGSGRVFTLSHEMTTCVGRAKLNDIVLDDNSVSSEHFRIRPQDGGFIVHDLKSTNGTYVNEKKVANHPLVAGDVIQIGETSLLFKMDHQRAS